MSLRKAREYSTVPQGMPKSRDFIIARRHVHTMGSTEQDADTLAEQLVMREVPTPEEVSLFLVDHNLEDLLTDVRATGRTCTPRSEHATQRARARTPRSAHATQRACLARTATQLPLPIYASALFRGLLIACRPCMTRCRTGVRTPSPTWPQSYRGRAKKGSPSRAMDAKCSRPAAAMST